MRIVERELGSNRFNAVEQFVRANDENDELYEAVAVLLKGPEISLAEYDAPAYRDKDGHLREHARVRWRNEGVTTLREIVETSDTFVTEDGAVYPPLPDSEVHDDNRSYVYTDRVPVFFGHYWRQGSPVHLCDWTAHTACVDFSAVRGGTLVAYRWSGESEIQPENYVFSPNDIAVQQPS